MKTTALSFLFMIVFFLLPGLSPVSGTEKDIKGCQKTPAELSSDSLNFSLVNRSLTPQAAFADIGCALEWRKRLCATDTLTFDYFSKVFDFYTAEEISADKAFYVADSGTKTPFAFDIIAFRSRETAEDYLRKKDAGKLFKYDEIKELEYRK